MPTPYLHKRNGTPGASAPSSLLHGELALNYGDARVFWKDASNVIQSFTFQSYALASHTHAASDITSGTLDAARLPLATTLAAGAVIVGTGLGVSSGTVSVTYGTTSGTACQGNDSRLSDARTPTSHSHGNITNAGAIGSTADQFVVTTTSGVLTAVSAATARTTLSVQPTASPAFTGSVGIGTSSPGGILEVNGGSGAATSLVKAASGQNAFLSIIGNNNAFLTSSFDLVQLSNNVAQVIQRANAALEIGTNGTTRLTISSTGTATFTGQILADDIDTANSVAYGFDGDTNTGVGRGGADILTFVTNGTERVRVDASGRVGIGTASPGAELEVADTSSDNDVRINLRANSTTISQVGASSTQTFIDSAGARSFAVLTNGTNRLIISSTGTITAGDVYATTVGATNRDLFIDSTGLIGYVSSIRESKTQIVTLDDVSWLSALAPVSYRYRKRNADGTYSDEADGVTDYGLIAEDVEAVRPELCFYDQVDGEPQLRGVTYSKLITPMLRYIQQLEARIAALEERLNG